MPTVAFKTFGWLVAVFTVLTAVPDLKGQTENDQSANLKNTFSWEDGWLSLFDQETTFGWRGGSNQTLQNNCLKLTSSDPLLRTSAQFACFQIVVQYRLSAAGQAELLLRTNPQALVSGVDHLSIPLSPEGTELTVDCFNQTDTNTARIRYSVGNDQQPGVEQVLTVTSSPGRGYLGFRVKQGELEIQRVMLRPVLTDSVELGTLDPSRWDLSTLGQATANHEEHITLRGGPGYLASRAEFADFTLTLEARTKVGTNSGVFFRCIPGESLNGYESQIHNGFLNGDRSQPEDCGTGGIFRRVDARRVVADNEMWFRKTLVVCGGQISVWVNGYQVTDWSDQRPANVNPRRGRRLSAGPIMLQAHDPTTHLEFKHLSVQELPSR